MDLLSGVLLCVQQLHCMHHDCIMPCRPVAWRPQHKSKLANEFLLYTTSQWAADQLQANPFCFARHAACRPCNRAVSPAAVAAPGRRDDIGRSRHSSIMQKSWLSVLLCLAARLPCMRTVHLRDADLHPAGSACFSSCCASSSTGA